ncbi:ribose transport system ATP-binding protein [Paenarthrobacter nicotinovorans]|uniref:ATP-binding cassette domain-containing protein n=1 Tax=Micrococcaceae TaxID=1268 RepID=UPI0008772816|nr:MULTISPECIES: ATP-binding cassette domain-containing protein [Micrococcaceae]MDR6438733.1 ribose transport system ATP-binding protein [Paenarthrobacter nicotinovorans]SCZ56446.1 ribose transport system ATP-binding protein [Arthrobacter sp. UNCCL28]
MPQDPQKLIGKEPDATTMANDSVVLRLEGVDKRYPGVHALKNVSLEVSKGEVHALVGENGAGKSTLVGVAAGAVSPDLGSVQIGGASTDAPNPQWSREQGLAIVYQEPALLPHLTVAENMRLGMPKNLRPTVRGQVAWAEEVLSSWKNVASIDPRDLVSSLRPDARFVVEIARAMAEDPKVIILDEPTEHLLPAAVDELFHLIDAVVQRGGSVVYISHKINEVKKVANTISVLRDGALEGTFPAQDMTEQDIVNLVVGHQKSRESASVSSLDASAPTQLKVEDLSGHGFSGLNLEVRKGEIVGFAGIEGQGQRDALRALAGLSRSKGSVTVNGVNVRLGSTTNAMRDGIVYLPHDRHNEGIFSRLSLRENSSIGSIAQLARVGVVSSRREQNSVIKQFAALRVKAPSAEVDIDTLSGGNQQKVVLSRVLLGGSPILLADEPTQGVDVGARGEIYQILRTAAAEGASIIVLSSSAAELEELCDRVVVFSRGHAAKELVGEEVSERRITEAALTASQHRSTVPRGNQPVKKWKRKLAENDLMPGGVLLLATIVLGIVAASQSSFYMTPRNFGLVLPLVAILAFFAIAQQLVMMVGAIDLSVGPLAGFLVVLGSFVLSEFRSPVGIGLGILIVTLAAAAVGVVNWFLTTVVKITPLIATLVTFTALQGFAYLLRPLPGGRMDPMFTGWVTSAWGFIPWMLILAIAIALVLEFTLHKSLFGIRLRAVGSNAATAKKVGVKSNLVVLAAYVGCSVLVVPASLLLMAQAGTGNASIGDSYTLASIGAVVLGGASIFGGRGSFLGAIMGAILVIQANTVVQFLGLQMYWQQWFIGGLTLAAAAFYSKTRALSERI